MGSQDMQQAASGEACHCASTDQPVAVCMVCKVAVVRLLVVWLAAAAACVEHLLHFPKEGMMHAGNSQHVVCTIHRCLKGIQLLHAAPQRLHVVVRTLRVLVVAAGVRVLVVARANTRIGRLLLLLTAMLALRVCGQNTRRLSGPLAHRVRASCRGMPQHRTAT